MTPERIDALRVFIESDTYFGDRPELADDFLELCDAALRLAAIENAGDEEVGLYFSHGMECANGDPVVEEALTHLRDIAKQRGLELAELRKACRGILAFTEGKKLNNYDRISVPTSALIALHEALGNPSEIPNSSFDPLDEHTLSQADADALKKMLEDGTAKARFPLTGHGITEVSDAAEGG